MNLSRAQSKCYNREVVQPMLQSHKFVEMKLGKAPFRFIQIKEENCICSHCREKSEHKIHIKSADNRLFNLCKDCIEKSKDTLLIEPMKNFFTHVISYQQPYWERTWQNGINNKKYKKELS